MGPQPTDISIRRLPQVLVATLAVVGLPLLAVSLLHASGSVTSVLPLIAVGTALSLATSYAGAAFWATRASVGDTVFGDLMVWGWLRRVRQERQLASAVKLLGLQGDSLGGGSAELSLRRRAQLLERLASALESRDLDTYGHSRRVARHATAIAKRMGLSREQVARIRTAAAVHDVGKIETPAEIMNKPGALSAEEFAVIKRHPVVGARMVMGLGDAELTRIVRHHHERLDGQGYPDGLAGDRIPLGARIVAVADTFDAVTSARLYRPARRHREALGLLSNEAGTQLDPDAVRAFRGYYSGLRPVALWALLLNGPRQLIASLGDELRFGGVGIAAKSTAATVATVAAGTAALHSLQDRPHAHAPRPAASALAALPEAGESLQAPASDGSRGSQGHVGPGVQVDDTSEPPLANSDDEGVESEPGANTPSADETPTAESPGSSGSNPSGGNDSGLTGSGGGEGATVPAVTVPEIPKVTTPVTSTLNSAVESAKSISISVPEAQPVLPKVTIGLGGK